MNKKKDVFTEGLITMGIVTNLIANPELLTQVHGKIQELNNTLRRAYHEYLISIGYEHRTYPHV